MVLVELRCVLEVAEISGREHSLSNQRVADIWDEGYRGAKRELEKTEWEGSKLDSGWAINPALDLKYVGQIQCL